MRNIPGDLQFFLFLYFSALPEVANFQVTSASEDSITVTWTPVTLVGNPPFTYTVTYQVDGSQEVPISDIANTQSSQIINSLQHTTEYTIRISIVLTAGSVIGPVAVITDNTSNPLIYHLFKIILISLQNTVYEFL